MHVIARLLALLHHASCYSAEVAHHNTDIEVRNKYSGTPLHIALLKNRKEAVQTHLQLYSDIKTRGQYYQASLHYAPLRNNTKVVQFLLQHNTDVGARVERIFAPLYSVSFNNRDEVNQLLLWHNADVEAKDQLNQTAPHISHFATIKNCSFSVLQPWKQDLTIFQTPVLNDAMCNHREVTQVYST